MGDSNAYILGTDQEELKRLELQHSIWSSESHAGWRAAGFERGDSILDLGCGPGSCSVELAKIVGPDGRIISIDRSESFIRYLNALKTEQNLPIDAIHADFDGMDLQAESLDGMYARCREDGASNVCASLVVQSFLTASSSTSFDGCFRECPLFQRPAA